MRVGAFGAVAHPPGNAARGPKSGAWFRPRRSAVDVKRSLILGDAAVRPANVARLGCRSLLRQPRFAQAFCSLRHGRRIRDKPLYGETGIEAASFRQGGLRLVPLAFERVCGGEHGVRYVSSPTGVERLVQFVDGGVVVPLFEFRTAEREMPETYFRIARTEPHRLPKIGLCLFDAAEERFGEASLRVERGRIWIDGETAVGAAEGLARAVRKRLR